MNGVWRQPRFWGVLLLAGVLLLLGGASFARRLGAAEPWVGVEWIQSSAGPIVIRVDPGSPAWNAGLRAGDALVAIDGQSVTSAIEAAELPWQRAGAVGVEILRGQVRHTLVVQPHWQQRSEPYIYLVIVGLAFWMSGLFIAVRWPEIRGGRLYSLLAASLYAQLTLSHTGRADLLDWVVYWIDLAAGALVPALLFHLAIAVTKRTLPARRSVLGLMYGGSAFLVLSAVWLSPVALAGAYRFTDPQLVLEARDRVETLGLGLSVLLATVLLLKSYQRSSSGMHRGQMRWLLWGLVAGLGPFVLLYAVPWALGAAELPSWARFLAVVPLLLVPATFTAALARYRLHDLDVLLLRGLWEVAAVFVTFAVLAATVFLLRDGLQHLVSVPRGFSRYIGFLVAAVAYPQLRSWTRRGVERAFYRQRYSYRATLLDWSRELNAETDLSSLLARLRRRIRETLGVPEAEVLLRVGPWRFETAEAAAAGEHVEFDQASLDQLEKQSVVSVGAALGGLPWVSHVFPMMVKDRLRAVLAVAERQPPEEPLTREDRALLGTLAAHAATAIEAARLVMEVRRRADEIENLHSRQARLLESSPVGLLLLDAQGSIRAWNRALEAIYGVPREEAVGRKLRDLFPLHVARRLERESGQTAGGEEARVFRLNMVNRNQRRLVVNLAISPEMEDGGRVVTLDDVTGRVEMEEQMLQNERLASLGLLAAGVAHEINTPLTGISSYTQMLLEDGDDAGREREILEKIEAQTRRATSITRSMLTLARPDDTVFEALNLDETVREVLQLFEPQIKCGGVRLERHFGRDLPAVRGHRGKLQQVLLNLLQNARDAVGQEGCIELTMRSAGDRIVIEIRDDGPGIGEEDLPRIFDPFFTTKQRSEGTGLGLSISYGIIREHGGSIHVDSQPGGWTRFSIELPVAGTAQAMA